MRSVIGGVLRLLLFIALSSSLAGAASAKSRAPIKLIAGETTGQQATAAIAGRALRKAGFKVAYVHPAPGAEVSDLAAGAAHAHPALIAADAGAALDEAIAAGRVRSLGGRVGNGRDEPVLKIVWSGMKSKWPYAQKLLKRMVLPDDEVAAIARRVDDGEASLDMAADEWMKANKRVWSPWIAASKNWMKP